MALFAHHFQLFVFFHILKQRRPCSKQEHAVAALRVGLSGTGPPSFVFGSPSLLAHPVFWPIDIFCVWPTHFLWSNNFLY